MNLYFHHFRKKDFEPSKDSSSKKKNDSKRNKEKVSKSSKNAYEQIELHQLAVEHALAYLNKPWDYYLEKEKSSKSKSKRMNNETHSRKQSVEEEVNFNSYLAYQNYDDEHHSKSSRIVEEKGRHFQDILSKNRWIHFTFLKFCSFHS